MSTTDPVLTLPAPTDLCLSQTAENFILKLRDSPAKPRFFKFNECMILIDSFKNNYI